MTPNKRTWLVELSTRTLKGLAGAGRVLGHEEVQAVRRFDAEHEALTLFRSKAQYQPKYRKLMRELGVTAKDVVASDAVAL